MSTPTPSAAPDGPDRSQKRPEAVFRIGSVSSAIFAHEVETESGTIPRLIRSVSLQRRYRDEDQAKYSGSFSLAEIPQAIRCLQLAQEYIEAREAQVLGPE